jgi:hypothetical protein
MAVVCRSGRDYGSVMTNRDLLIVAGDAAERLERHGLIACGRREDGVARVDFWTRDGKAYRHALKDETVTLDEVVASCLAIAGLGAAEPRSSHLS